MNLICMNSSRLILKTSSTRGSLLFESKPKALLQLTQVNTHYTYQVKDKPCNNTRTTRPKVSKNRSIPLTYEQSKFAEEIGYKKSWNSWNTSNLLDGNRQPETTLDDIFIRKFIYSTWHGILASEIIIKRKLNTITLAFLINRSRKGVYAQQIYFLCGYTEELLSALLKCVVKIEFQTVASRNDTIFRYW